MANFGDVALNLPKDWDRARLYNQKFSLQTVGHKNGVADAYLTKDPDAEHQFYWVDPRDYRHIAELKIDGYKFVEKGEWTINEDLWGWSTDDRATFGTEILMARPAEKFYSAQKAREDARKSEAQRKRDEEAARVAAAGMAVTDERGQRISRRAAR